MAISRNLLTWLAACAGTLLPFAATLSGNAVLDRMTGDALCTSANPQATVPVHRHGSSPPAPRLDGPSHRGLSADQSGHDRLTR